MLNKFANDDQIELMNAATRRAKQLEHRKAVEQLIEERRARFAAEREAEINEYLEEQKRRAITEDIIEEERQKLLREHASKLAGYMPKGVFRNEDEIGQLDDAGLWNIYSKRSGEDE